ncbi:alpha-L-rhamnosidase-related protein [Neolewinella persica]|uniref:alpha-L-rhamnosidase-related protein n=1 Tax=Neolewinella persica TaxID=70998 RepID=UPI0003768CB7|nr:alpha-L-rhamnosidase C-terminal domain-containing protein [Neolewinella persica]
MKIFSYLGFSVAILLLSCQACTTQLVDNLTIVKEEGKEYPGAAAGAERGWITAPAFADSSVANTWLVFRKEFDLSKVAAEPIPAEIAADTKYWLWVNDSLVIREGGLKWGPVPMGYYTDVEDLGPYLHKGSNKIEVLVWYFGKDGFSHKSSGQAGLSVAIRDLNIFTDTTWKVGIHEGFAVDSPAPRPNYRLPESNINFMAQKAGPLDRVDQPLYGFAGDWLAAIVRPNTRRVSVPRPIPQWKDFGLRSYENSPTFPFVSTGDTLRMKLPYNAQVTANLTISAPAAAPGIADGQLPYIDIRTDNYFGGGPPNVRTIYHPRPGSKQTFESPGWFNGHEVIYTIPAGITVHDLKYRETGFATEFTGAFSCDDDFYNRLWEKARRTLYVTMRDSYMDCPDRERAQWWGDVVLESGETFYALDRKSDRLTKKAILELMEWQRPDSTIYSPVPAGNWDQELPTQMLASVGYYGIWNYYLHTGDEATIKWVYPAVKRYLHVWETDADGLVIPRKGGWTWGDWGDEKDMPLIFNGWYYLALKGFANMAKLTGNQEDVVWASDKMERFKVAYNRKFWTGKAYRSPANMGATDDRGQALAVVSGLAPAEHFPAIREVFRTQAYASPYFEKYVEEALFQMGYADDALARMKRRFGPMVKSPLTTLWEGWDIGSAKWGGGTNNHAWSGGGLTLLSQYVVGIVPLTPGYGSVRIRPQLGSLNRASAYVDTPLGLLKVEVRRQGNKLKVDYDAPDGMAVIVVAE